MSLTTERKHLLEQAIAALYSRVYYTPYPEHPAPSVYGETADADGQSAFKASLGKPLDGLGQAAESWVGAEVSPFTQEPLGISYPATSVEKLIANSQQAAKSWANATADERANVLIASLEAFRARFFEVAYATMHTTGQGYMMAFQASGPHAADRALEAIAMGYAELTRFTNETEWSKPMGKITVNLRKWWRAVPKGINVVVGCSTFPTWNTVPGLYAGLITGNPVIVKPHGGAILPAAIVVAEIRKALKDAGFDANVCQLAPDTVAEPITKTLVEHPAVKLVDYTGGTTFGNYIESLPGKITFTEKAGINSVLLESVDNVDAVAQNLAFSICLYSGQMCTAPQNFFVPVSGIKTADGLLSADAFAQKLADAITGLATNPKAGPFVLGAIQNPKTAERVKGSATLPGCNVVLESTVLENPQFPNARTATPALLLTDHTNKAVFGAELFGPIAFVVTVPDADQGLQLMTDLVAEHGNISCGIYSTDQSFKDKAADALVAVGSPVSFNLTGGIYLNQHAAFSDFHVTGANAAGNASFSNPEFVLKRFTLIGLREPSVA